MQDTLNCRPIHNRRMDIANRLDLAMKAAGIYDQSQLSRLSNVGLSTLNRILSGRIKKINVEDAAKLARTLCVSTHWLALGEENPSDLNITRPMLVSEQEARLILQFRSLNQRGRAELLNHLRYALDEESQ